MTSPGPIRAFGRDVPVGQSRAVIAQAVLELPPTPQAPGIARKWLSESFAAQLEPREQETAKLLVSELVTNAVVHGRGRIELHAELDQDRLLVDVSDEGPGFARTDFHAIAGHGSGSWTRKPVAAGCGKALPISGSSSSDTEPALTAP